MGTESYPTFEFVRGILYGPVDSRRLGRSLGVNILPTDRKTCTFDCCYCQLGLTPEEPGPERIAGARWPAPDEVATALEKALGEIRSGGAGLDVATLCGDGEPTLHPRFLEICRAVSSARDAAWPEIRTAILTNGTELGREEVQEGLRLLDRPLVKLDAGTETLFRGINRAMGAVTIDSVLDGIRRLPDPVIQSMFVRGAQDNTTPDALDAWLARLADIHPREVQIYSLARRPADGGLETVPTEDLERIAERVRTETGASASVY